MEEKRPGRTPFGINAFGIAVQGPESKTPSAEEIKRAILAAVEAIPAEKLRNLKNLNNGRLTILV